MKKRVREFCFALAAATTVVGLIGLVRSAVIFDGWLKSPALSTKDFLLGACPWLVLGIGGTVTAVLAFCIGLYVWVLDALGPNPPPAQRSPAQSFRPGDSVCLIDGRAGSQRYPVLRVGDDYAVIGMDRGVERRYQFYELELVE